MNNLISTILSVITIVTAISFPACGSTIINGNDNKQLLHEKTYQISPGKMLKVETSVGDIKITGWDKSEAYVKIVGGENIKDLIDFTFDHNSDQLFIKAKINKKLNSWSSRNGLHFEIKVPQNFNTKVATSGGDIELYNLNGSLDLNTSGGDLTAKDLEGNIDMSTSGGDINFENVKGEIDFSTSGGDITGTNFSGNLEVATSGGDIKLKGGNSKIDAATSGGDISLDYSGENKGIELVTSGGNVKVNLPSDFNASAKLVSSAGNVDCEFEAVNPVKISSSKFQADINKGGRELTVKTSGGFVKVSKK